MPLHDWSDDRGWDSMLFLWLGQLLDWVQPRLPVGFRAYIGAVPALTFDATTCRPDLSVRNWPVRTLTPTADAEAMEVVPDEEAVATFALDPQRALHIDFHGQLIAATELVSPRNKDRPSSRARYLGRYLGYLRQGVHLLLIDVLPKPPEFSFMDAIALDLGFNQPACPPPCAVSYRVGESVPDGTVLGFWHRLLQVGQPLPLIALPLNTSQAVSIDLEQTYQQAAKRAYLE